jgi:hypothetical protein
MVKMRKSERKDSEKKKSINNKVNNKKVNIKKKKITVSNKKSNKQLNKKLNSLSNKSLNNDVLSISKEKDYNKIMSELEDIKLKEIELLKKISYDINKENIKKKKLYRQVEHFSFNDFAQIMIGCCVFGLPAFINTSFWEYIPKIRTDLLIWIHLFFILCVLLALNYEFRENFSLNSWFFKMLLKRFFFTYFSVFMIILLLLGLVNKMTYSLENILVFRNFIAAQSVGIFGAITFSFLKK